MFWPHGSRIKNNPICLVHYLKLRKDVKKFGDKVCYGPTPLPDSLKDKFTFEINFFQLKTCFLQKKNGPKILLCGLNLSTLPSDFQIFFFLFFDVFPDRDSGEYQAYPTLTAINLPKLFQTPTHPMCQKSEADLP